MGSQITDKPLLTHTSDSAEELLMFADFLMIS